MRQVQAVVHAHTNEGHDTNGFYGPEFIPHDSKQEAKQRAYFLNLCRGLPELCTGDKL